MRKNIILSGMPRSGKSTLLERIISEQKDKIGFITKEVIEGGERTGFEVINQDNTKAMLASIHFKTNEKVSKYYVNINNLEQIIPSVLNFDKKDILYLDEIAQMELYSENFKKLALKYLDSSNILIATIKVYDNEFVNQIKGRKDVIIVDITPENREEKYFFVKKLIQKIQKAKRYASEPDRFKLAVDRVSMRTDHGEKHLVKIDDCWECDCQFYTAHDICSHVLALEEYISRE